MVNENITRLEIIGHIGVEEHILINPPVKYGTNVVSKELAIEILERTVMIGGAAAFGYLTTLELGAQASIFTCVGRNDLFAEKIIRTLNKNLNYSNKYIRKELTNYFLSIWDKNSKQKQLYFHIDSDLSIDDVKNIEKTESDALLLFGLTQPSTTIEILKRYKKFGIPVSFVPNQTIIEYRQDHESILSQIKLLFVNQAEALNFTKTSSIDEAIKVLIRLIHTYPSIAAICVTQGDQCVLLIEQEHSVKKIRLPNRIEFTLGGGDVFASAVTTMFFSGENIEIACHKSTSIINALLETLNPFSSYNPLVLQ
nr:carbohydrate kinase family protein [Nostoc sp. ChiSLP03a]MDZ8214884.1 carbohydrate kinase family protein [Nostoc sp. ChiSLP03a]